jgi:two-component system, chemotaxis family, chemotaxis protein CheY
VTRILAVDDSPSMREMIRIALTTAGFTVTEVSDGQQALDAARGSTFDLVLSDVHMPNMDGIALIRALRAEAAYRHTPILMLTTEASPERKREGKQAGATGWIIKPFDAQQLIATMRRVLG